MRLWQALIGAFVLGMAWSLAVADEAGVDRWADVNAQLKDAHLPEALAAYRVVEKAGAPEAELASNLYWIAERFRMVKKDADAMSLYKEVAERWPATASGPRAVLAIGEIIGQQGDEAKMIELYEKAAGTPLAANDLYGYGQSGACSRLALLYEKKGKWAEALKWWTQWNPRSWCGTCNSSENALRLNHMLLCNVEMDLERKRPLEAIKRLEAAALAKGGGISEGLMVRMVDLCRENGELEDLNAKVKAAGDAPEVSALARYLEMLRLAEKGDYEPLWREVAGLEEHPESSGMPLVARVLAGQGEKVTPFLVQKLKDSVQVRERAWEPLWVLAILGYSKAPETLDLAKERIKAEGNVWGLRDIFYALALLGTEEAYVVIRDNAENATGNHKTAAEQILKIYPKPGSLNTEKFKGAVVTKMPNTNQL
jgi:tetratricopeptide (TPR) repeat protein